MFWCPVVWWVRQLQFTAGSSGVFEGAQRWIVVTGKTSSVDDSGHGSRGAGHSLFSHRSSLHDGHCKNAISTHKGSGCARVLKPSLRASFGENDGGSAQRAAIIGRCGLKGDITMGKNIYSVVLILPTCRVLNL